jgi:hypothetical protein
MWQNTPIKRNIAPRFREDRDEEFAIGRYDLIG